MWFSVGQPPNGDGCSVLLLMVPPHLWPVAVKCLGY